MKRTTMTPKELKDYINKWTRKRDSFRSGSKNWRKCNLKIKLARKEI